jgi:hypothetical protein
MFANNTMLKQKMKPAIKVHKGRNFFKDTKSQKVKKANYKPR